MRNILKSGVVMKVIIEDVTDLESSIKKVFNYFNCKNLANKNIFIKPNMLRIAHPDECIITDPRLLGRVTELLLESGAVVMVGDNPIPQGLDEIEVAKRCGLFSASCGTFRNIGRFVKRVKLKNKKVKGVYVSKEILECDILISIPKFKTHELTTLSLAIKNQFGIIPGGLKPKLHSECFRLEDFCNLLIDIYQIRPPDLIIIDCIKVRDARGRLYNPNKLIAGDNGFAIDYVCSLLAGIDPATNPLVNIALKKKLFEPRSVEIIGNLEPIKDFATPFYFPLRGVFANLGNLIFSKFASYRLPVFNQKYCNNCRLCENVCPSRAIQSKKIDYKRCIKCYCCIEVCPNNAIGQKLKIL
ncbi:MAG: DUF362 domain-containing protein [candidate division WOR-3 bacterium]